MRIQISVLFFLVFLTIDSAAQKDNQNATVINKAILKNSDMLKILNKNELITKANLNEKVIVLGKQELANLLREPVLNSVIIFDNFGPRHRNADDNVDWIKHRGCSWTFWNQDKIIFSVPVIEAGVRGKKWFFKNVIATPTKVTPIGADIIEITLNINLNLLKGMCPPCAKFREDNGAEDLSGSFDYTFRLHLIHDSNGFLNLQYLGNYKENKKHDFENPRNRARINSPENREYNNLHLLISTRTAELKIHEALQNAFSLHSNKEIFDSIIRQGLLNMGHKINTIKELSYKGNSVELSEEIIIKYY